MHQRLRSHLTYANVISTLALFIVLGGTAYAVDGPLAGQNTVGSEDIINTEVKTADLGADSVSSGKIADGQVKSADVLNDNLTAADLASGSVAGSEIQDGSVANADVAPNSVASGRILDGTLTGVDVADNSLKGADIDESTLSGVGGGVGPPEAWHAVAAGSTTTDACADPSRTATFCSEGSGLPFGVWTNYGGSFATAAFYKDQLGIVHMKGLVHAPYFYVGEGVQVYPIFRLPVAYRPTQERVFPSVGTDGLSGTAVTAGRVDVESNGLVKVVQYCNSGSCSANGPDLALDGISFRPDG